LDGVFFLTIDLSSTASPIAFLYSIFSYRVCPSRPSLLGDSKNDDGNSRVYSFRSLEAIVLDDLHFTPPFPVLVIKARTLNFESDRLEGDSSVIPPIIVCQVMDFSFAPSR